MDEHYNTEGASKCLHELMERRAKKSPAKQLLNFFESMTGLADKVTITEYNKPRSWRITLPTQEDGVSEEVVVRIQGIVCDKHLPPVLRIPRHRNVAKYMHQSVHITGLNDPLFVKALENLAAIQNMFERHVDKNDFDHWSPISHATNTAFELKNRYFTYRRDDPHALSVPLAQNVDPTGQLATLAGPDLFHGEDNVVVYCAKLAGSSKFKPISPCAIRVGDIIEVQMSLLLTPIKNGRFKMIIVLRGIAILNTSFTDEASTRRTLTLTNKPRSLKRKLDYDDDDDEEQNTADQRTADQRMDTN